MGGDHNLSSVKSRVAATEPSQPEHDEPAPLVMKQYGKIEDMDRTFDVTFWQAQSPTARLNAAWELVEFYARLKGHTDELRLQRSVETFQRQRR